MKRFALLAILLSAACAAPPPGAETPIALLQVREPANDEMEALAHGVLVVRDGCLRIDSGANGGVLVIWPASARLEQSDGAIIVSNLRNGASVTVGASIEIGGGEVNELDVDALTAAIPAACGGPYWIAGSTWRVTAP